MIKYELEDLKYQLNQILNDVIELDGKVKFRGGITFEGISQLYYFDSMDKQEVIAKLEELVDTEFSDEFVAEIMTELTIDEICDTIYNLSH